MWYWVSHQRQRETRIKAKLSKITQYWQGSEGGLGERNALKLMTMYCVVPSRKGNGKIYYKHCYQKGMRQSYNWIVIKSNAKRFRFLYRLTCEIIRMFLKKFFFLWWKWQAPGRQTRFAALSKWAEFSSLKWTHLDSDILRAHTCSTISLKTFWNPFLS